MSGYCGYSKSNNAIQAERENKFPKSKWTKELIMSVLADLIDSSSEIYVFLSKKPAAFLKDFLLVSYEWHHTSSYYNCTEYYEVREDIDSWTFEEIKTKFDTFTEAEAKKKAEKAAQKEEAALYECEFLMWSGSRKHPKATAYTEIGEIKGAWFYSSYGKKSINANGFKIIRRIED